MKKTLILICSLLLFVIFLNPITYAMGKISSKIPYSIYYNGKKIKISDIYLHNNKNYIGIREFCEKIGMDVKWVDPKVQQMPSPGGNFPSGINIINPSYIYVKELPDYRNPNTKFKGVDITGVYEKYNDSTKYKYYFNDKGLVVSAENKTLDLDIYPYNGHIYISVEEFREKVQPYFVDICMQ